MCQFPAEDYIQAVEHHRLCLLAPSLAPSSPSLLQVTDGLTSCQRKNAKRRCAIKADGTRKDSKKKKNNSKKSKKSVAQVKPAEPAFELLDPSPQVSLIPEQVAELPILAQNSIIESALTPSQLGAAYEKTAKKPMMAGAAYEKAAKKPMTAGAAYEKTAKKPKNAGNKSKQAKSPAVSPFLAEPVVEEEPEVFAHPAEPSGTGTTPGDQIDALLECQGATVEETAPKAQSPKKQAKKSNKRRAAYKQKRMLAKALVVYKRGAWHEDEEVIEEIPRRTSTPPPMPMPKEAPAPDPTPLFLRSAFKADAKDIIPLRESDWIIPPRFEREAPDSMRRVVGDSEGIYWGTYDCLLETPMMFTEWAREFLIFRHNTKDDM